MFLQFVRGFFYGYVIPVILFVGTYQYNYLWQDPTMRYMDKYMYVENFFIFASVIGLITGYIGGRVTQYFYILRHSGEDAAGVHAICSMFELVDLVKLILLCVGLYTLYAIISVFPSLMGF